jgi:hypothetical protein
VVRAKKGLNGRRKNPEPIHSCWLKPVTGSRVAGWPNLSTGSGNRVAV